MKAYKSDQHKIVRMNTVTATIENGFVYVADSAPWLQDFLHELSVFPNGRHDDQADSMSQALDWFKNTHSRMNGLREFYARQGAQQDNRFTRLRACGHSSLGSSQLLKPPGNVLTTPASNHYL